jgi:hypothetical protein
VDFQTLISREYTWLLVVIAVVVALVIVGIVASVVQRKQRTTKQRSQLRKVEYERTLKADGNRGEEDARLDDRTHRAVKHELRPLSEGDRARFLESWRGIQSRFVDGPAGAVMEADQLMGDLMTSRGYPVGKFDKRGEEVSVDHPLILQRYQAAHDIVQRQARAQATTEDLRQAMVQYRTLFEELVSEGSPSTSKTAF